jgi:hypothetical protein
MKIRKASLVALATISLCLALTSVSHADPLTFTATYSGSQENPPNASPGTGTGFLTLDGHNLTFDISFAGLSANDTDAHIHCCTPIGTNTIVAIGFTSTGFPLGVRSGTYLHTFDLTLASTYNAAFITASGGTVAGAEARLVAALFSGQSYLNIHTGPFPAGEIRGNVVPTPEPATMLLIGTGLAGVALKIRRKLKRDKDQAG